MKQYYGIKGKYPDAVLLFRVGDFYETFGDDAVKASKILGITLTKRGNGSANEVALAGFPHHAMDTYLPKLVRAGERVAICDQLEEPTKGKKIVDRGVTELVTPAVSYSDQVLDNKANHWLAAVHMGGVRMGVSFLDLSTGEFLLAEGRTDYIDKLIQSFGPKEVLYEKKYKKDFTEQFGTRLYAYGLEDWVFQRDFAHDTLLRHFKVKNLKGYGVDHFEAGIIAAGAALHYLADTQHDRVNHIRKIRRVEEDDYVWMDRFTIRNLELLFTPHEGGVTLLDIMDQTVSPMGARLMKRWIALPLKDIDRIRERHEVVGFLKAETAHRNLLVDGLKEIGDLERLVSKVSTGRINPREVNQLHRSLVALEPIKSFTQGSGQASLKRISEHLDPCEALQELIAERMMEDPPVQVSKGGVIAEGVSEELDELRGIAANGKQFLIELQERESARTGITSLKVAYNNVFGYYLEVRNTFKDKVPEEWIRKQTLVSAERYITEELKELETKILGAQDRILTLETKLYQELIAGISEYIDPIQINAQYLAQLDVLNGLALLADEANYVAPEMDEEYSLDIRDGRHPVIEKQLPLGEQYVSNDVQLDRESQQIIMITGPNMSGKSALLRQTALISLMAQMGSFVPARSAKLGIVDKVFTRVGASDNISLGESTFMVEMNETASILNNLSDRSLILLDEIGRGTSTYDGISIAWSIAEFIHEHPTQAKTLFATHYHELNEMTERFSRIANYNVSVKEVDKKIIFLRKLAPGGSNHSFGIHVAQMAGMPAEVVGRSKEILRQLEQTHAEDLAVGQSSAREVLSDLSSEMQLSFFQLDDPVLQNIKEELIKTDINNLTPVEALMKLNEIKKMVGG